MFISLNVEPHSHEASVAALDALRAEFEAKGLRSRMAGGATGSCSSMISTAISSCSTQERVWGARLQSRYIEDQRKGDAKYRFSRKPRQSQLTSSLKPFTPL
jgi:hypothetical protein